VYHGVFTLIASPKLRLDKNQPRIPKRVRCAEKNADQEIKFDQSVFAIKMIMIQASEPPLHIGFKVRRQTFPKESHDKATTIHHHFACNWMIGHRDDFSEKPQFFESINIVHFFVETWLRSTLVHFNAPACKFEF
jgi:hypothetical protein